VDTHGSTDVHSDGAPNVHIALPLADVQALLAWWRRRKHLLAQANKTPAATERWTLHIEQPFIIRIKAEAKAEHVTVTKVGFQEQSPENLR
jgi:hypothetical protein